MNSFLKGVITGAVIVLTGVLIVTALRFFYNRDKQIYEYMERQHEIEALQKDGFFQNLRNRDPDEFLDDPGVRGAADRGLERINRKRDEILHRGEVQGMIEELTETAKEAIETAAAEAARAAVLASLEREVRAVKEAEHWEKEYRRARRNGVKNAVLAGVICFLGGFVVGAVAIR
jgi:hypothetical protein